MARSAAKIWFSQLEERNNLHVVYQVSLVANKERSQATDNSSTWKSLMSIDLTLQRIGILLSHFEHYTRPTVHIAGTNGKGSVSALLTQVFLASGLIVGRFNSPHLTTVSDSIAINDSAVELQTFESVHTEVISVNESHCIKASSFETLTVTALLIFERAGVDVVLLEVGMGGRLDATNVIPDTSVLLSVITSIDLDHMAFLGTTVREIAREKAGIIRRHRPVILSLQQHSAVEDVVREICNSRDAPLTLAPVANDRDWVEETDGPLPRPFSLDPFYPPPPRPVKAVVSGKLYNLLLPLHGTHQMMNLGTAMAVIHALLANPSTSPSIRNKIATLGSEGLSEAIRSCVWPGRLSFHSIPLVSKQVPVLADGAHNESGASMLSAYVTDVLSSLSQAQQERGISLTYIISLSHSPPKTSASVLLPLLSLPSGLDVEGTNLRLNVAFVRFTTPEGMPWVKPVQPSALADIAREVNDAADPRRRWKIWTEPDEMDDVASSTGLCRALDWVAEESKLRETTEEICHDFVIVAGSLYLVADLYRLLRTAQ